MSAPPGSAKPFVVEPYFSDPRLWFVAPPILIVILGLFLLMSWRLKKLATREMSRYLEVDTVKDCARGFLQNISVVGTLLVTVTAVMTQMGMTDPRSMHGQAYYVTSFGSVVMSLGATIHAIALLLRMEPLNNVASVRLLISNPGSIAISVSFLLMSTLLLLVALLIWAYMEWSLEAGVSCTGLSVLVGAFLVPDLVEKHSFSGDETDPAAKQWKGIEESVRITETGKLEVTRSGLPRFVRGESEETIEAFHRLALMAKIQELEQREANRRRIEACESRLSQMGLQSRRLSTSNCSLRAEDTEAQDLPVGRSESVLPLQPHEGSDQVGGGGLGGLDKPWAGFPSTGSIGTAPTSGNLLRSCSLRDGTTGVVRSSSVSGSAVGMVRSLSVQDGKTGALHHGSKGMLRRDSGEGAERFPCPGFNLHQGTDLCLTEAQSMGTSIGNSAFAGSLGAKPREPPSRLG
uniref:Transmembrane protein n=1 Tax=Chromera velia CCMP2878 TaxID=1169474 RepID=A0A0G4I3J5_9ALVE|eukprot:Cvel_1757.t1-p1 / transcript=Cvel_1757.t1 / gene=Cvel_1757 / organism=Chromera_velia_CCMP2878 / gene_product=hypothetical protein / transcript_product=hypothetical protein / location=Cvel_scaffold64:74640-76022(+) / protein_length=461 / sequence_SO=supercontig / SO=protein_coding / is_pseudo=false